MNVFRMTVFYKLKSHYKHIVGTKSTVFENQVRSLGIAKILFTPKNMEYIRNVGIFGQSGCGKTTLIERIVLHSEKLRTIEEKKERGADVKSSKLVKEQLPNRATIQSAVKFTLWKNYKIHLINTQGQEDNPVEIEKSARIIEGSIFVICALEGVKNQTITANIEMKRFLIPCLIYINKIDCMGADINLILSQIRDIMDHNAAMMQIPIGFGPEYKGIIDLVHRKALYFDGEFGEILRVDDIPADLVNESEAKRQELIEKVYEGSFSEGRTPTGKKLICAIRQACSLRKFTPIFMGAALQHNGVQALLDGVLHYLPYPDEVQNYAIREIKEKERENILLNDEKFDEFPLVAMAFKLESTHFGQLTYMRCYVGCLRKGDAIKNTRTKAKSKVTRLIRIHANTIEEMNEVYPGDIFGVFDVDCTSGDTFIKDENWELTRYAVRYINYASQQIGICSIMRQRINSLLVKEDGTKMSREEKNKFWNELVRKPTFHQLVWKFSEQNSVEGTDRRDLTEADFKLLVNYIVTFIDCLNSINHDEHPDFHINDEAVVNALIFLKSAKMPEDVLTFVEILKLIKLIPCKPKSSI